MEFKVNIGDPKTKRSVQKVVSGKEADFFLKKKVGDKISGDPIGFAGYEFEITGGSDYCGFPMRKDVRGTARKKVLIVSGVGIRKNVPGRKIRKTVAGSSIYSKTAQINLKILKAGATPLIEPKEGEKPAEGAPKAEEKADKTASAKLADSENKSFLKPAEEKKEAKEEKPEAKEHKEAKPKKEPKKEEKKE